MFRVILGLVLVAIVGGVVAYNKEMILKSSDGFEKAKKRFEELESREDLAKATLAGGCFWCMEGPFEALDGVEEVMTGYAGGEMEGPTYKQVLTGTTGHKESVRIYYDADKISFEELLNVFWRQIDPTDDGGQFVDRGEQYKTAIFYHDDVQRKLAEKSKAEKQASGVDDKLIVTEILATKKFFPAEDYHGFYC